MLKRFFLLFCFIFPGALFCSVTPQTLHMSYLLAKSGFGKEAEEVLASCFDQKTYITDFLADQFVKWSTDKESEMEDSFNKSAFYVVKGNRLSSIKAIRKHFRYAEPETDRFAESFTDWGIGLIKINSALQKVE
ncbi:hypothetical protein [Candidatus Neptunochlamydia vexilliferae]|uniref:Secreted protein n=1 Tax=Candidatus Neptunichlamydia vexilliferae TaxID=1651774 RepID=A0ABS0AYN1_9BACT|nr:hypothetical protein [Candidatus Neptunochlamydia vexilliferae]MBF5059240.1 hypothetical protein [Candidatus Neptunochlamydia vexilliferae]